MRTLHTYIPQDRLRALKQGYSLPDRTIGSALFADISSFTPLTEILTQELGPRRGIEELARQINALFDALITEIEKYGGSVISLGGDAITCWFDGDTGLKAATTALALQTIVAAFPQKIGLKIAVTTGPARRFVVGDPAIQWLDTLAGATIARLATAEQLARRGEVLLDTATAQALTENVVVGEWRTAENGERFAIVTEITQPASPLWLEASAPLPIEQVRPWVIPAIFDRHQSGHGVFLTELRAAAMLFLRFTGLDYDNDEQAGHKLDTLIRRTQHILARYEGTLLQLSIGDKGSYFYAVFGAPIAHENDPRRAVQAALELRQALQAFDFLDSVQMGLSSGVIQAGAYGGSTRGTYGVLGDEVNVAARLMTAAQTGEILVTESMQNEVGGLFDFGPCQFLALKGKAEALPVFALLGQHLLRPFRMEEPHYTLPMIGREAELALIQTKLNLVKRGQGQVIGITAEAGMGKSRLVAEVIQRAHQQGFVGYGGACESLGMNTPYLVWKGIWQAFFKLEPTLSFAQQIQQVENKLQAMAPMRVPALPLLSLLLDIPIEDNDFTRTLEPKDRRNVLTAVLEECLRAVTEPQLFILEDLHWIDALSHDLLEALTRTIAHLPICFVLAYRPPEIIRVQAPRIEKLPFFTAIPLSQLTAVDAQALIRAKLAQLFPNQSGELSDTLITELTSRAEGNPFFIEELLNYLHDCGLNPYEANTFRTLELPTSLQALILSRMDQLSEPQKVTLKTASIIGRVFSLSWLHGYYPALGEISQIKSDLTELMKLDLTPLDVPEPEPSYLFKHIVTREVAYKSLTYAMRAQLHEQLAQFIETLQGSGRCDNHNDPYLDLLAFHYGLSENKAKQREYFQKAGDMAQAAYANETAVAYFSRLLPLLTDVPAQLTLLFKLADAHYGLSNFSAAHAVLTQALQLAVTPGDRAIALVRLSQLVSEFQGDYPQTHALLSEALPLARQSGSPATLAHTLYALGDVHWRLGDLTAAVAYLDESLPLARQANDTTRVLFILNRLGAVHSQTDLAKAEALWQEVYRLASAEGNRVLAMAALNNLGVPAYYRSDWATASALYRQALTLARELGIRKATAIYLINLASVTIPLGQYDEVRDALCEGLLLASELGAVPWVVTAVLNFAELLAVQGQTSRALALVGLCQRHPAFSSENRRETEAMLSRWKLDPADVTDGLAQGATLDFATTVNQITHELTPNVQPPL